MLFVMSSSCVVHGEYRNLVLSVTSIESCVLRGRFSGEYRNLVLSVMSIEILCRPWRV